PGGGQQGVEGVRVVRVDPVAVERMHAGGGPDAFVAAGDGQGLEGVLRRGGDGDAAVDAGRAGLLERLRDAALEVGEREVAVGVDHAARIAAAARGGPGRNYTRSMTHARLSRRLPLAAAGLLLALLSLAPRAAHAADVDLWYVVDLFGQRSGWSNTRVTTEGDRITTSSDME